MTRYEQHAPGKMIIEKEPKLVADFTERPDADAPSRKVKLVRFPELPENWGPLAKAKGCVLLPLITFHAPPHRLTPLFFGCRSGNGINREELFKRRAENQGKNQAKRPRKQPQGDKDATEAPAEEDDSKPDS